MRGFYGLWILRGCQRACEGIHACPASILFVGGLEGFVLVFMCVGCDRVGKKLKQRVGVNYVLFRYKESISLIGLDKKLFIRD